VASLDFASEKEIIVFNAIGGATSIKNLSKTELRCVQNKKNVGVYQKTTQISSAVLNVRVFIVISLFGPPCRTQCKGDKLQSKTARVIFAKTR